jgi:hypothetical protein
MMKNKNIAHRTDRPPLLVCFFFLVTISFSALAQEPEWEGGELEDVEVVIENTRENTVPSANRNFEMIPPRPAETIIPPIRYDFQSFSFLAPQIKPVIRPLKIKAESPNKIYGGYVRAGFGNFGSPLLEGYITSRKDKDKLIGAHLYHFSSAKGPVEGTKSGSGNTTVSVFGKSFSENFALSGRIDAENRTTHFYGHPLISEVDGSDIKQAYNTFKIGGDVSNARNSDFRYTLGALFSYLSDKYDAREMGVDLNFNSGYKVSDDSRFNIDANYNVLNRKDIDIDGKARSLFSVSPSYLFSPIENLKINLGATVAFENDTIDKKDVHFFPNISASYPISPSVDLLAALTGGMEKVSLQSLSNENIWLAPNAELHHINKSFDLTVAINARLGNKVGANAGLSMATMRNMHFFRNTGVNPTDDQSKFIVDYERDFFRRTNLYGSLSYAQSEKVKLMLRGDVFAYGRDDDSKEVWHLPKYKLNASASFNVAQKFLIGLDVIGQGGMKAWDPGQGTVKLDGALDVNAKVEYLFSDSFSVFVQFNNITGNEYPLFYRYPVRGFQFLGGITWSF